METCCAEVGNSTVNFQPDCYSWCNLEVSSDDRDEFDKLRKTFASCLHNGENSRPTPGRLCGGVPSQGSQNESRNGTENASDSPSDAESGAVAPEQSFKKSLVSLLLCGSLVLAMLHP